jgi:hypothetical protein
MEFGPDKCTTAVFKHGKLSKSQNIILNNQRVIQNVKLQQTHKNMGIGESDGTDKSDEGQTSERILPSGQSNSQDRVKP